MGRMRFDWTEDIQRLGDRFDDFFDRLFSLTLVPRNSLHQTWHPDLDIFEVDTGIVIIIELPGVREEDLDVTVQRGRLRIAGVRHPPRVPDLKGPLQIEIEYGPFERVITVPSAVDPERVAVRFQNGMLSVSVPCSPETRLVSVADEGKHEP